MSPVAASPSFVAAALMIAAVTPAVALELALPVQCTVGVDCAVQHYVDRDPGSGAADFRCSSQTYDGHDGTDIRVPTLRRMTSGVGVVAAADGVVAAVRDEMPDQSVVEAGLDSVKDRECGNGLVIEHGDGWETQYCHMKRGSIRVKAGDRVAVGAELGEIGLSGQTEFPHLHLAVRRDGQTVDPFAAEPLAAGAACAFAGNEQTSLWTAEAKAQLQYRPAFVLNAGFSNGVVSMEDVESGQLEDVQLKADSPAIVFFGRAIGIQKGDRQVLILTGPDGQTVASNEVEPTDRPKAQFFAFAGKKRRDQPWAPGVYRGRYSVMRGDAELAFKEAEVAISP